MTGTPLQAPQQGEEQYDAAVLGLLEVAAQEVRAQLNRSLETSEARWYPSHMTAQFLTDDRGQKVAVVIPIADYESLMEDVADLAAVAERRDDERISLNELKEQLTADGLLPR